MATLRIALLLCFAFALAGCAPTAELIPGEGTPAPTATPTPDATATPAAAGVGRTTASPIPPHADVASEVLAPSVVLVRSVDGGAVVRQGTGVVVDTTARLVLTAFSIVNPVARDASPAYRTIEVGTNASAGNPPVALFRAELVVADPTTDVAVLRVVSMLDGSDLIEGAFDRPTVTRGDGFVPAGAPIRIFAQSGEAGLLTITFAEVTGLHNEIGHESRTRLKTDAILPIEAAGGPAFDTAGQLVGFATAEHYFQGASITELRPLDLANPLIRLAEQNPSRRHVAAPERGSATGGAVPPAEVMLPWVSGPRFAAGSAPTATGADLFDLGPTFPGGTESIFYEYTAIGVPDGTIVEERWYFEDEIDDHDSSTFVWNHGAAALVVDGIEATMPIGFAAGRWRLEIALDGEVVASGVATVLPGEVPLPGRDVAIGGFEFASGVTASQQPEGPPAGDADALLLFFDYQGMAEITTYRWLVFHRGLLVFQSPDVPWLGGERGRWWVGYRPDEPIEPGQWQFEVHVASEIYPSPTVVLP